MLRELLEQRCEIAEHRCVSLSVSDRSGEPV
jgi:hypothetical protein